MTWILIVMIYTAKGVSINSTEFNTKEACFSASMRLDGAASRIMMQTATDISFVCVEKGSKK